MTSRTLWAAGAPVRWILVRIIRLYRVSLAGLFAGQCRFYPSCSAYAEEAIRSRGAARGVAMAAWRVLRCNPFGKGGVEHVGGPAQYEDLIQRGAR